MLLVLFRSTQYWCTFSKVVTTLFGFIAHERPPYPDSSQTAQDTKQLHHKETLKTSLKKGPGPYHFFSGIGLGTALTRQGKFGWPDRFLPKMVPTRFRGRMTKKQIQQTATCREMKSNTRLYIYHDLIRSLCFL